MSKGNLLLKIFRLVLLSQICQCELKTFFCGLVQENSLTTVYHFTSYYASYNTTDKDGTYHFNFCQNVIENNDGKLNNTKNTLYKRTTDGKDMKIYGGENTKENQMTFTQVKKDELTIHFPPGGKCTDNKNYKATVTLYCGHPEEFNITSPQINYAKINKTEDIECDFTAKIYTSMHCTFENFYIGSHFVQTYKWIIGPLLILIGIYYIALGSKIILPTVMLANGLALMFIVFSIVFNIFGTLKEPDILKMTNVWIVLGVSIFIGFILGGVFWKFAPFMNLLVLNSGIGYCLMVFLFHLFMKYFDINLDYIYWISMVIFAIGSGLLSFYFTSYKNFYIVSTSILGGYFFVRGFAILIGEGTGFISENKAFNIESDPMNKKELFTGYVYIFLALWVAASAGSVIIQKKITDSKSDNDYAKVED